MRIAFAAVALALAAAPAAQAGPIWDTVSPVVNQVPPVCVRQPLPEPVPFGQVQVGYCPA
jgi:hypothetical protein